MAFSSVPLPRSSSACLAVGLPRGGEMWGLPCFVQTVMDDLAPASTPAVAMSVCLHGASRRPDCVPFWLEPDSVFGSVPLTMRMAVHLGWACPPVWPSDRVDAGSLGTLLAEISLPKRRCVIPAASDPTVASRAGAERRLRTEPQVCPYGGCISKQLFEQLHVARTKMGTKIVRRALGGHCSGKRRPLPPNAAE